MITCLAEPPNVYPEIETGPQRNLTVDQYRELQLRYVLAQAVSRRFDTDNKLQ